MHFLNIVPVEFSSDAVLIGRQPKIVGQEYRQLRDANWETHAFRLDKRFDEILNVPIGENIEPIGKTERVDPNDYLLLIARAIQHDILVWLANKLRILTDRKRLVFWGQAADALLLARASEAAGVKPDPRIEVVLRYDIDCRMFKAKDDRQYLGLVIDMGTSNIIDYRVSELLKRGMDPRGRYVCQYEPPTDDYLRPRPKLVGKVRDVRNGDLMLSDSGVSNTVSADAVFLEPRTENLHAVVNLLYGPSAQRVLIELEKRRAQVSDSQGKLAHIRKAVSGLRRREIVLSGGFRIGLGELINSRDPRFPVTVQTQGPSLLFGPQGRRKDTWADRGVTMHGPYMHMLHQRNAPLIAVVCEAQNRGRVEQFLEQLRVGIPDELWEEGYGRNPFIGGLIGKFRLASVRFEIEEVRSATAGAYKQSVRRLLERLPVTPDLAIIQVRESFVNLHGDLNPYLVSKAAFMSAGVPTQGIRLENMELPVRNKAYLLNNLALATYAKLDGMPWVMSTAGPTTHELVIGLGATEVREGRTGERKRYVGITSVFQGDGRYLVWGATREVEFDDYQRALLEALRLIVNYVSQRNAWQEGDNVRLICHVYKRLKNTEVNAVKSLVTGLLAEKFGVEFAFLDVSWSHPFHVFSPSEQGKRYWDRKTGASRVKGRGAPPRGLCLQLDRWRGLLQLTGPRELKFADQGVPKPLLVELHPDSDYTDMVYLLRQLYHFSFMSWRSFFPGSEPVTIAYSRLIARLLGNLKGVNEWDSRVLSVGGLRDRRWFL